MAPLPKMILKDKVDDGEMDLSMLNIQEVPVKDIAVFRKVYFLDLSNNNLSLLPQNFSTLVNLTKLDLSKNQLTELPDNFGNLTKLKYLDLYKNQLTHLPVSFCKLKLLYWLDLKDNPLVPAIKEEAGQCVDQKQCQACARNIVHFFTQLSRKIEDERELRETQRVKDKAAHDLIALKQKQREKKLKKKEQPNNKQTHQKQVIVDDKTSDDATCVGLVAASTEKASIIRVFCKYLCILTLFVVIYMFVLTAGRYAFTDAILDQIARFWRAIMASLPQIVRPTFAHFEAFVKSVHSFCGAHILHLQQTEQYKLVVDKFHEYF